ncbi:MAG: MMPL family transporter [Bacteroidetes bacterium]|nr:MMPL family transporter [Bacteroidota bacterium]
MKFLSSLILRYKIWFLLFSLAITAFMSYKAKEVEITYYFARLLPDTDTASIDYEYFKSKFGQDGTVLVLGADIAPLKKIDNFNAWCDLSDSLKKTKGIENVLSVGRLQELVLNDSLGKFEPRKVFSKKPKTQKELDSIWNKIETLKFYDGIIFNTKSNSTLIAVTFGKKDLNTKNRLSITDSIKAKGDAFSKQTGVEVHYSGMPYIRTNVARKIQHETTFFLGLTILVTGLVLFFFFRSLYPVVFSLIVVCCGVVFSVGLMVLFGFKLTAMSAIIPPLIIVIGVPNCILILNKYHTEFSKHNNKIKALHIAIERSSVSLFFANTTTAIGFAVFCTIKNYIFFEFGLVSSISVMATYLFSLMIVPAVFSFLPPPSPKQIKHIDEKRLTKILQKIDIITTHKRSLIYIVTLLLVLVAGYGLTKIKAIGYVVDDLPKKDVVLTDLHYFEEKNGGVLPFEITIDTKRENGIFSNNARALYRINKMQKVLAQYPEFSKPLSVTEGVKFFYQAYKGGDEKYYRLPSVTELKKIAEYVQGQTQNGAAAKQLASFIDSTKKVTRVSISIKDVGSVRIKELIRELKPRVDSAFNYDYEANKWMQENERYDVRLTGNCVMFLKGNEFLIDNLLESVVLAIILIAILMFSLFTSPRMILISIIPSLIALLITAGIMGFLHVPLKPSTILVFSIAFGISSDGTLYFLTKYRHEVRKNKMSISKAVSLTIQETGISMVYTALILTMGFGVFGFSDFGGTAALGVLLSLTLLIAYTSNLILLPCFLLSLEKSILKKEILNVSVFDIDDEQDDEHDETHYNKEHNK